MSSSERLWVVCAYYAVRFHSAAEGMFRIAPAVETGKTNQRRELRRQRPTLFTLAHHAVRAIP